MIVAIRYLDTDVEQAHPEADGDGEPGQEQRERAVEDRDDRGDLLAGGVAQVDHHLEHLQRVDAEQAHHHRGDHDGDEHRQRRREQQGAGPAQQRHAAPAWAPPVM
jgi:hypothetical protein